MAFRQSFRQTLLERGQPGLQDLAQRLEDAECAVRRRGEHWMDFSRFPPAPKLPKQSSLTTSVNHLDPVQRVVHEILEAAAGTPPADDVSAMVAERLRVLGGPTDGFTLLADLPGRKLPAELIKRVIAEFADHGLLVSNPAGRGWLRGELDGRG